MCQGMNPHMEFLLSIVVDLCYAYSYCLYYGQISRDFFIVLASKSSISATATCWLYGELCAILNIRKKAQNLWFFPKSFSWFVKAKAWRRRGWQIYFVYPVRQLLSRNQDRHIRISRSWSVWVRFFSNRRLLSKRWWVPEKRSSSPCRPPWNYWFLDSGKKEDLCRKGCRIRKHKTAFSWFKIQWR